MCDVRKAEEGGDREKGGVGLPAGLPFSSDKGDGVSWGVQVAACMDTPLSRGSPGLLDPVSGGPPP